LRLSGARRFCPGLFSHSFEIAGQMQRIRGRKDSEHLLMLQEKYQNEKERLPGPSGRGEATCQEPSPHYARTTCYDRGYGRPSGCPRMSNLATYCQVRLRSEPLWLPAVTTISTISRRSLVHNAGWGDETLVLQELEVLEIRGSRWVHEGVEPPLPRRILTEFA
jgi:hypothetical protein